MTVMNIALLNSVPSLETSNLNVLGPDRVPRCFLSKEHWTSVVEMNLPALIFLTASCLSSVIAHVRSGVSLNKVVKHEIFTNLE